MTEPDAVMARIGEGIALRECGERVAARDLFEQVWSEIGGENGDPFHRCALAHSMADVQDDVHDRGPAKSGVGRSDLGVWGV